MNYKYNIALDAMGGDNAPKKVVEGLRIFLRDNKEIRLPDHKNHKTLEILN